MQVKWNQKFRKNECFVLHMRHPWFQPHSNRWSYVLVRERGMYKYNRWMITVIRITHNVNWHLLYGNQPAYIEPTCFEFVRQDPASVVEIMVFRAYSFIPNQLRHVNTIGRRYRDIAIKEGNVQYRHLSWVMLCILLLSPSEQAFHLSVLLCIHCFSKHKWTYICPSNILYGKEIWNVKIYTRMTYNSAKRRQHYLSMKYTRQYWWLHNTICIIF